MVEYRLTPAAERDLEAIWVHTDQRWGVTQAMRYTDSLTGTFAELAQAPQTGLACDHIRPGYRRRGIGRHVIYYQITAYGIAIVRILHDRMDAPQHL